MGGEIILQFIALSIYVAFLGFIFCDFFKLPTAKKLIWFAIFLYCAIAVLESRDEFDLSLILPVPTLLAIVLGVWQKRKRRAQ